MTGHWRILSSAAIGTWEVKLIMTDRPTNNEPKDGHKGSEGSFTLNMGSHSENGFLDIIG